MVGAARRSLVGAVTRTSGQEAGTLAVTKSSIRRAHRRRGRSYYFEDQEHTVEVRLGLADGLPRECVVNLDDLLTIPKGLLLQPLTVLSAARMSEVSQAIKFSLALD